MRVLVILLSLALTASVVEARGRGRTVAKKGNLTTAQVKSSKVSKAGKTGRHLHWCLHHRRMDHCNCK
ncbi:MAG: hypothetical protein HY815_24980 [Candidatus Riflebacteria bacterium]|nr:hypothetical protein [Candidatus Riflebacteria bacterium]